MAPRPLWVLFQVHSTSFPFISAAFSSRLSSTASPSQHSLSLSTSDSSSSSSIWDCTFTFVSFLLFLVYLVLLAAALRFASQLVKEEKRRAQKLFLAFAIAQCVVRVLYFVLWPFFGGACEPVVAGNQFHWTDVLATLPADFFLSAFTILTFTFARIYHTVLRLNSPGHRFLYHLFCVGYLLINIAVYVVTIVDLVMGSYSNSGFVHILFVGVASFLIALGFLVYGLLLYFEVNRVLFSVRARHRQDSTRFTGEVVDDRSDYSPSPRSRSVSEFSEIDRTYGAVGEHEVSSNGASRPEPNGTSPANHSPRSSKQFTFPPAKLGRNVSGDGYQALAGEPPAKRILSRQPSAVPTLRNPMTKIAIVSIICMFCFTLRSFLLPAMENEFGATWPLLLVYFLFSEVLPLALMLHVFNTKAASSSHAQQTLRPNTLLVPHP